jgi:c-di-GMP-binding flagellar brake protein YcgR
VSQDAGGSQPVRVIDLGLGGARLSLSQAIPLGTALRLSITAPHLWDALVIHAEVVWVAIQEGSRAARVGVRFMHASGASLRALTELLDAASYR